MLVARLAFYEYGTDALVGTLDLKSGASLNLGTVPAGQHFSVRGTVQLDEGTGAQDLPSSVTIGLGITP